MKILATKPNTRPKTKSKQVVHHSALTPQMIQVDEPAAEDVHNEPAATAEVAASDATREEENVAPNATDADAKAQPKAKANEAANASQPQDNPSASSAQLEQLTSDAPVPEPLDIKAIKAFIKRWVKDSDNVTIEDIDLPEGPRLVFVDFIAAE